MRWWALAARISFLFSFPSHKAGRITCPCTFDTDRIWRRKKMMSRASWKAPFDCCSRRLKKKKKVSGAVNIFRRNRRGGGGVAWHYQMAACRQTRDCRHLVPQVPFCRIRTNPGGRCVSRHAQNFLGFAREVENIEFVCVYKWYFGFDYMSRWIVPDSVTCRSIEKWMKQERTLTHSGKKP